MTAVVSSPRRRAGRPLAWALAGLGSAAVLAAAAWGAPTLDDQVYAIAREFMCPVCAGQTVAESDAELARQMRAIIRARLTQGQSREEIIAYFVAQFGQGVLAAPPARGSGVLLWVFPAVAAAAGAVIVWTFVRRHLGPPGAPPAAVHPGAVDRARPPD